MNASRDLVSRSQEATAAALAHETPALAPRPEIIRERRDKTDRLALLDHQSVRAG